MNEQITLILKKPWVIPTAIGVASFSLGAGLGYILGLRKEDENVEEPYEIPDNQMSLFESIELPDPQPEEDMELAFKDVIFEEDKEVRLVQAPAMAPYTHHELDWDAELAVDEDEDEDAEPIVDNVFAHSDDWDYDAELATRTSEDPYILHQDEFINGEMEYDQSTLVYYAGDDIMADESDTPLYGYPSRLGELKFGHGSTDKAVVYIRNEKLHAEWEVLLHTGRFEVEVLGNTIEQEYEEQELKHSVLRFRDE